MAISYRIDQHFLDYLERILYTHLIDINFDLGNIEVINCVFLYTDVPILGLVCCGGLRNEHK